MSGLPAGIDFNNLTEPAYVWVGHLVPDVLLASVDYDESKSDSFPMLVRSINGFQDFPKSMKPRAEYFRCPRLQGEACEWLVECGGIDALDWLVEKRCVLRVDPVNVLSSFASVHLEKNGLLVGSRHRLNPFHHEEPVFVMMGYNPGSADIMLTEVMRDLLFSYEEEPLPSLPVAVRKCAGALGKPVDAVQRELFSSMAALLRDDYAFFLYVDDDAG